MLIALSVIASPRTTFSQVKIQSEQHDSRQEKWPDLTPWPMLHCTSGSQQPDRLWGSIIVPSRKPSLPLWLPGKGILHLPVGIMTSTSHEGTCCKRRDGQSPLWAPRSRNAGWDRSLTVQMWPLTVSGGWIEWGWIMYDYGGLCMLTFSAIGGLRTRVLGWMGCVVLALTELGISTRGLNTLRSGEGHVWDCGQGALQDCFPLGGILTLRRFFSFTSSFEIAIPREKNRYPWTAKSHRY